MKSFTPKIYIENIYKTLYFVYIFNIISTLFSIYFKYIKNNVDKESYRIWDVYGFSQITFFKERSGRPTFILKVS